MNVELLWFLGLWLLPSLLICLSNMVLYEIDRIKGEHWGFKTLVIAITMIIIWPLGVAFISLLIFKLSKIQQQ